MKKSNCIILFSFLLLQIANIDCFAQTSISENGVFKKDAQVIKDQPMIVILLDEDKEYISKMNKKGNTAKVKEYTDAVNYYNSTIKELAGKYLTLPKELQFNYFSEIKLMPMDERRSCSFLAYGIGGRLSSGRAENGGSEYVVFVYDLYRKTPTSSIEKENFHFNESDAEYCKFEIYTYRKSEIEPLFEKPVYHPIPTKADIAFSLMRANKLYEMALNDEERKKSRNKLNDHQVLNEKTLAICKEDLSKKGTEAAIKATYKYPFQIMSKEEIDHIFLSRSEKYLVLMYVSRQDPSGDFYYQEIVDVSSLEIIDNVKVDPGR